MKVLLKNPTFGIVLSLLNKILSKLKCKVGTFMLIKEFTWSHSPDTYSTRICAFGMCDCNRKAEWRAFVGHMLPLYYRNCDLLLAI